MKKRLISTVLILSMLLSLVTIAPVTTYAADYIAGLEEVKAELGNSGAFYPGTNKAVSGFGLVTMPAEAFVEDGNLYVPLTSLEYIFLTSHESFSGKTYIEGKDVTSSIVTKASVDFITAKAYAAAVNLEVFDDSLSELIILGKNIPAYTWHGNRRMLSGIIGQMNFEFPTSEKIVADVTAKHGVGGHPRILATEETFDRIKAETGITPSDDYEAIKEEWLRSIKSETSSWSARTPVKYGPTDHIRMREQSGTVWAVVGFNSFMYKLTGIESYAERAWLEISTICADTFPDWNPNHLLDTGQIMNGMALGYDWLYDWMDDDQKALMRRNIVDKGLAVMCDIFDGKPVKSSWATSARAYDFYSGVSNWNFVSCGGAVMSALAIFDDCEGEDRAKCERVLQECVKIISFSATAFSPSGDWFEGPAYARLSNETMTEACASLMSAAGTDYGIMDAPGVEATSETPLALIGEYSFNYSNAGESKAHELPNTREFFFHADRFDRPDFAQMQFKLMSEYGVAPDFRDFIYCTRKFDPADMSLKTDYYLKDSEIVTMRNADVEEGLIFAALHGGDNERAQGHLDIGTFVIDSFGDRFASDLGLENYNLLVTYYHKYRNRAEGHNTLIINPDDRTYDQTQGASAIITRHEYDESSSIAVVDMNKAYKGYAKSAIRGMKFINDRTSILLKDEVRGIERKSDDTNEVYWFMHTKADITLSEDKKTAILNKGGNLMYATLVSDGEFGVMAAQPLPTSPNPEGQNANSAYQKLYIHYTNVDNLDIAVCFTPGIYYDDLILPSVTPIDTWTLDGAESIASAPRLSSISIDGKEISDFDSETFHYIYESATVGNMPEITATGEGTIDVELPKALPGKAYVTVSASGAKSVYTIDMSRAKNNLEKNSFRKLLPSCVASTESEANKTTDSNMGTYVTLDSSDYLIYSLDDLSYVNYVSASGANPDLTVFCSADGVSYTEFGNISDDTTAELFLGTVKTKYIKLVSNSDDSIVCEVGVYGYDGFEYSDSIYNEEIDIITAMYEVGEKNAKTPLTFENFEMPEGENAMPQGLNGKWSFGYNPSPLVVVESVENGRTGKGIRFKAPQKYFEDTNSDGSVNAKDEPAPGTESIADNNFQYPRLRFTQNSPMPENYHITFSVKPTKPYVFQLIGPNTSSPIIYYYLGTLKAFGNPLDISFKDDMNAWYDFDITLNASGDYTVSVTKASDPSVSASVSGNSDVVTTMLTGTTSSTFYFQHNSYPYDYHEVLLDDIYFGELKTDSSTKYDAPVLKYVKTDRINLTESFSLMNTIDVPEDGKSYEISVFVWADGGLVPILNKTSLK